MELPPPGNRRVSISNPQETPHRFSTAHGMMPARSSMASSTGSSKPHALPDAHRSSIQSSVPGGSLLPSPIPQKSALIPPDAAQRRGSTVSSVHYADEQGKPLATDKEKDKEKKGKSTGKSKGKSKNKGAGLLNMLKKTLQGSQSEEMVVTSETPALIPFGDVVGCLAVHIKSCRQFSHRFIVQQHVNLFIRISINHITKWTKLRNLKAINNEKNLVLRFDEVKYFSVQVPRRQDDERNNIVLELMQDGGNAERPTLSLGSVEAHLYEIIQKGCFTEVLQMKHRNTFICRVEVEFMFSYGSFGYGFSHQLKPLQKIIEPSMFMKIAPPPERTDPVTNVITPQRVEYPAFLSPELNVSIGAAEASHPNAVRLEKLQEKPRERLEKMKEEYKNLNTWMEKSEYLRNLITPKVASKVSEEPSLNEVSEANSSLLGEIYGTITHGFHHRKSEPISHEFVDKGDKEGRAIPVVKLVDQDFSEPALPESGESTPGDTPLPPIHTLQIIEEDETPCAQAAPEWEDIPYEERKSVVFPPDESLIPKRPSILRIASSQQEARPKKEKIPHFSDALVVPDKPLGQENTNQKGKPPIQLRQTWERHPTDIASSLRKVAFVQKEYTTPVFRADSREFTSKHQKLIKSGLDPFLRNINSKMPFRNKKGQDAHRSPSIFSTDGTEHEDQDPPYPEHSRSAGSHAPWAEDPNLATIHMVNKKNNLPPERTTTTTMAADRKNTLSHDPTINTTDTLDMKNLFTSDHPVHTITKLSDTDYKLSTDPSSNTAKPSDTRLSSVPSSNTAKPSDRRLSSAPSSNSSQPSVPNRLSHNSSIISTKSSDLKNKLSRDPSTILTKPSGVSILSHDSSNNAKKSSDTRTSSRVLSIISTKSLDSKNKLPGGNPSVHSDLTTNTARTPASRDKVVRDPAVFTVDSLDMQLPNVPVPKYQKESSAPGNVNVYHPSSSISLTSDVENRRQSIVLKSIFSRNLQDLSDKLFPNPDTGTNAEAIQGSSSLHDRPSGGTEDKVFEKVQDIKSWLSSKDILNSQALLSTVVKSVPQAVFPEGGPGTSSDTEDVSGKLLGAAEINFPTNRKSSFKTKHLVSEVSSSSLGLNGGVYDHIIKQIFTAPILSQLEAGMALSEAQPAVQEPLLASWERSASSQIDNYEEDSNEVPWSPAKSSISRILQSFPVETLLESGIISVTELEKENQSSLLDVQTASPEEKTRNLARYNVKSQTKLLSRQTMPTTNPTDTFMSGADYKEDGQSVSAQESKHPRADKKSDLPKECQHLDTEGPGLSSTLETLGSSFVSKLKDIDAVMLKSFLKNIFKAFFKYNQSEKELDRLIPYSLPRGAEHLEKIQGNFNKADKVDRKATLDPKLCGLLEKLSESEVKNLKVELSKRIQHYLIERLLEVGHITKEDLPKVYRNLCQMSEKAEAQEPSPPQDKYSETIKEVVSFVNSFNHHFVDKHLETKLRSFLNEILQKYFLKNLSGSNLFNETDSMALRPSMSSLRSKSTPRCLPEMEQDIASGGLGSKLKINMKYPLSESLQNCLNVLPGSELLGLKKDLNKCVQVLFIEKLHKSGLISERELKGISQQVNSLDSSSRSLKYIKSDLPLREESYFTREDSEKRKKYPKVCQNPTLPTFIEDICGGTELTRKKEKGGSFSHGLKENPPTVWGYKHVYSREVKTLIKVQPHPNKNIQANPSNKSPERPADISLKKHQKDHCFMQLPQSESSVCKTETQASYSWDGRSKPLQPKLCFEKTLRAKSLDKRESNNICKWLVQEKPDTGLSPYLKLPTSKMSRENEHLNRLSFPTWQNNTFLYVNTESGEQSKLAKYCQKWKGNNNNNKKHLVTFAQFKNEMETLYTNPYEACHENCTKISESQPFEYKEDGRNPRPSFFPEVLKREHVKSKRKERDYTTKPKKSFYKLVRILPATLPTRPHLRKSVPRTLLHWTARRTIHDCLDRFDDLHMPSVKHPKNSKSRARLLGKSPDDSHNQAKHCARPYTAPEPNKRRESVAGKFASPRMVSAGLVHIHDTTPEYEIRKIRSKRKLKENIEKCPLICDIIQMLDTIG